MYTALNGWTKDSMKAQIRKYNNGTRAVVYLETGGSGCVLRAADGNRCAIGCFLNEDDIAQPATCCQAYGTESYYMPLSPDGMVALRRVHDTTLVGDVRDVLCDWIGANVRNPSDGT